MRVLLIDGNNDFAGMMASNLGREGYVCDVSSSLRHAEAALTAARYSAIIMELSMPDGDGIEWLSNHRLRYADSPTLILSKRKELEIMIASLDAGADDYLVQPVNTKELCARLRAVLRRPGSRATRLLRTSGLTFDVNERVARFNGRVLELTNKENCLLEILMRREGVVVTRELIEQSIYTFDIPGTPNALEAIVSRLRRKLKDVGAGEIIHTMRGMGYMLKTPKSGK